jgi:glutamine amidotransferase
MNCNPFQQGKRLYVHRLHCRLADPEVNTLFVSTSVHDLRLLLPAEERFQHFSDEARVVVSEPLIDLPGQWHEIPPSTALIVRDGPDSEDVPFVPCPP